MVARSEQELQAEIRRLMTAGEKVAAIKVYREATGVGLAEAKEAVERIGAGWDAASAPSTADLLRLRQVLAVGNKIEAIRLYREMTGAGLGEAKAAVEVIAATLSGGAIGDGRTIERPRGANFLWLALALSLIVAGTAFFLMR